MWDTVNPKYFVCMLFSYISYTAASVRARYKASQRICSGQRLYENVMRTKGRRAQDTKIECVQNILDLQYSGINLYNLESMVSEQTFSHYRAKNTTENRVKKFSGEVSIKCHQSCSAALVFCTKLYIKRAVSLCSFSQFSFPFNFRTANALVLKFGPLPLSGLFSNTLLTIFDI